VNTRYNEIMVNKDDEYLGKLQDYYADNGILPSFSRIAELIGLRTTSAVSALIGRLKISEHVASTPERRLIPGLRFFDRPLADSIRAGSPTPSNDLRSDVVSIDRHLIQKPSHTVLLSVRGDSMVEAGILDGDTIIAVKCAPYKVGDIVIAIVDSEFTVKYLAHDKHGYFLKPGNKAYSPIRAKDHLEIFGLVVGSFRKY
jgi:SOS-response transcriptional repressor LexA